MQSLFQVFKDLSGPRGLWVYRRAVLLLIKLLNRFQIEMLQLLCIPQNIAPSFKEQNGMLWEINQFNCLKQILSFRGMVTRFGVL